LIGFNCPITDFRVLEALKTGDVVVFNYPDGDTTTLEVAKQPKLLSNGER